MVLLLFTQTHKKNVSELGMIMFFTYFEALNLYMKPKWEIPGPFYCQKILENQEKLILTRLPDCVSLVFKIFCQ